MLPGRPTPIAVFLTGFAVILASFGQTIFEMAAELLLSNQLNHRGILHASKVTRLWTGRLRADQNHYSHASWIALLELRFKTIADGARRAAAA